ncbi:MAG: hypothetical protein Q9219_004819 [cf. Caloplaca sp. 3 TL-2023]
MASSVGTQPALRLKLVIRRLPPGLTEDELQTALGDQWRVGNGRVDWASYKPGKISKDPTKISKPSRAYLNLTKQEYISLLSDTIRNTKFNDSKNSTQDPVLYGPPSVEFAPFGRVPRAKVRKDARQGTIDQDPEFIEFLESLTNPVVKPAGIDQQTAGKEKITTTPLIQYLKEKKANKGKENSAATAKGAKHGKQVFKDTQSSSNPGSDKATPAKSATPSAQAADKRSAQAIMVENAARDAARVLNQQAAAPNKPQSPSPTSPASPVVPSVAAASSPLAEKKRERGSVSAAASILRRDLGIGTNPGARGGRRGLPAGQNRPVPSSTPKATSSTLVQGDDAKATDNSTPNASNTSPYIIKSTNAAPPATAAKSMDSPPKVRPPTGPAASRVLPKAPASSAANPTSHPTTPSKAANAPPSTATQAFLKHANPSQGITEPLLEEAFSTFGPVKRVEIDRKKGSAYVDFEEPDGLQKAIKASPVKVAQGQVVVLERRIGPPNPQARNNNARGGPSVMNHRGAAMDGGRGGLANHQRVDIRGAGVVNNRGGGIPMGPVGARGGGGGGGMRARGGGFPRGSRGNHMPSGVRPTAAAAAPAPVPTQQTQESKTPASTAAAAAQEDSTPNSSLLAPAPSSRVPADNNSAPPPPPPPPPPPAAVAPAESGTSAAE